MRLAEPADRIWRLALDVAFALVLPPLCFYFDPVLFFDPLSGVASPAYRPALTVWLGSGLFIAMFWLVRLVGPFEMPYLAAVAAGALFLGSFVAVVAGLILLPMTLIAILIFIGVLGLVPFGTAWRFYRLAETQFHAGDAPRPWLALIGASGVAVAIFVLGGLAALPIQREIEAVRSGDVSALERLAIYPLCLGPCVRATFEAVCPQKEIDWYECPADPEAQRAFKALSGVTFGEYENRLLLW